MVRKASTSESKERRRRKPRKPVTKASQIRKFATRTDDRRLIDAINVWEALEIDEQHGLTSEIARSRAAELRLAYPSVVSLSSGYRTCGRWGDAGDRRRVTREPCVVFMVNRKWAKRPRSALTLKKELPRYLLAFCNQRTGKNVSRVMCAVPVDVIQSGDHAGTLRSDRAERSRAYDTGDPPRRKNISGSLAALVRSSETGERYALTCHHFGAMSKRYDGDPVGSASIELDDDPNAGEYATLSEHMGRIVDPPDRSVDAALLRPTDGQIAQVRRAIGPYRPDVAWSALDNPPERVVVVVSNGREPATAKFVHRHYDFNDLKYFSSGRAQPVHLEMWEYNVIGSKSTFGGDSGCAVLDESYQYFVGMHLGGVDGSNRIFVLPAYLCLDPESYGLTGTLALES